ncbi:Protein translocase subunit SecA, partial [Geodia barretti]
TGGRPAAGVLRHRQRSHRPTPGSLGDRRTTAGRQAPVPGQGGADGRGRGQDRAIAFAAALHAVLGRRVHVITANDYLADRDAALLGPVYRSLGLDCGAVLGHMERRERRHIYRRGIIYGAMRELGFDHLRDHLGTAPEERVQQPLDVAIVDEADHALIDEAYTPLIISGNPLGGTRWAVRVNGAVADMIAEQRVLAEGLAQDLDANDDRSPERLRLLAKLILANPDNKTLRQHVSQALHAHLLQQRDVDYLVDDDSVVLIDQHTGRPKPDSIYQHGLQQAVEAREGVTVQPENETLAQISVSGLVSRYGQVAGITGTAEPAAGEFRRKYGLVVAVVPPAHPLLRTSIPPAVYLSREDKLAAVVDEVEARHRTGQPVLVGTRTVEQSEELAGLLSERRIPHRVLNAVTTHTEAAIVRDAGAFGAVTVATHMAGRGTDILLTTTLDFAPGLCVMGTEVHDSSRITLQLNGRSGRQGQFGMTQTFLSLEDRLVNLDAEAILKLANCRRMDAAGLTCYTGPDVSRRIQQLQDAADREGESQRALIQDYAAELDHQTHLYHQRRQELIGLASDTERVRPMCEQVVAKVASRLAAKHLGPDVDNDYAVRFGRMQAELRRDFGVECSHLYGMDLGLLPESLAELLTAQLDRLASRCGGSAFPELARLLYLQVCGELWPGHLTTLRDLLAVQLLSGSNHKSSVAAYILRCTGAWNAFWDMVDEEFLSRLATLQTGASGTQAAQPVKVSGATERLLAMDAPLPVDEGHGSITLI